MSCSFAMFWGVPSWILNKNRPFWSLFWSPVSRHVCRRVCRQLATINIRYLGKLSQFQRCSGKKAGIWQRSPYLPEGFWKTTSSWAWWAYKSVIWTLLVLFLFSVKLTYWRSPPDWSDSVDNDIGRQSTGWTNEQIVLEEGLATISYQFI